MENTIWGKQDEASPDPSQNASHTLSEIERRNYRILYVEDSLEYENLFKLLLLSLSPETPVEADCAASVEEASEKLGASKYDVIFLDLTLGSLDGVETLKAIQNHSGSLPIIVLTANEDRSFALELIRMGAQDILPRGGLSAGMVQRAMIFAMERKRIQDQLVEVSRLNRTMEMQLIQAEKLESLGQLAAGVAHEVKNPLGAIMQGSAALVRWGEVNREEQVSWIAGKMKRAAERATAIIQGINDFARNDEMELKSTDPVELANVARQMCTHFFDKAGVSLRVNLRGGLPRVRVDPMKMSQVLINLLLNALHAVQDHKGEVTFEVFSGILDLVKKDEGARQTDRLRVRDQVIVFEVADDGPGIPPEKLHQIFDPFFTTKPTGVGTGLGLSVAKKIVNLHGGEIEIKNRRDSQGCRARIYLKAMPPKSKQ